ncbi:MAG TPA: NAD(P)-dependent oxidoreductase [Candidatus Dormibacteraeota bacterium]|jgi:nucleoside-diphosphate-sugar epimerase
MKVFLAGGSGVIGRRLIPQLVAAGHQVSATSRSAGKAAMLQSLGASPVVVDALDAPALRKAVIDFRPDVVMNQLTDLPQRYNPRTIGPFYERTARLRVDATRTLLAAATDVGARRFVYQSMAFMYEATGPTVLAEDAPLAMDGLEPFGSVVRATAEGEQLALSADGITGVVLRYGQLYGPGSYFDHDGDFARQARRRMLPIVGNGGGIFSFLHVDDAASAAVIALGHGDGVYNIVDDEPVAARDWIPAFCRDIGAPSPMHVPGKLVELMAGRFAASTMQEGRGASNGKAKKELGWSPRHPTCRDGFVT